MIDLSPRIFETIMLVCFGCSWPFAIAKTIRTKTVTGKSIVFIILIFVGYMAGIIFKLIGHLDGVILLYFTNGSLVFTEIVLYFKFRQPEDDRTEIVSPKDKKNYQVSNSPIFHLDGSVSKLTIFRDNTEVKKIEPQLQQAQKLESVGRLAGGVAHDYINALSVIIGFAELAMDERRRAARSGPIWTRFSRRPTMPRTSPASCWPLPANRAWIHRYSI